MRIVFMGTPDFACPTLQAVVAAGFSVVGAVTQPDRPSGRGGKLTPSPVKRLAERLGISVLQPSRVRHPEAVAQLQALAPDLLLTAAFGQILSPAVLAVPRIGALNVHASLLPGYRGAAPIHRAVMDGAVETGVTIMWMDAGLDTGDILLARTIPVAPDDTAGSLHDKLAALGAELAVTALGLIARGLAPRLPQDHTKATYAAKLARRDEWIDWSAPATTLIHQARGLNPWPVAFTTLRGSALKVWKLRQETPGEVDASGGSPAPEPGVESPPDPPVTACPQPGTYLGPARGEGPRVATGDGVVILLELQPEGKRPMSGAAWLAGAHLAVGERFGGEFPLAAPE